MPFVKECKKMRAYNGFGRILARNEIGDVFVFYGRNLSGFDDFILSNMFSKRTEQFFPESGKIWRKCAFGLCTRLDFFDFFNAIEGEKHLSENEDAKYRIERYMKDCPF